MNKKQQSSRKKGVKNYEKNIGRYKKKKEKRKRRKNEDEDGNRKIKVLKYSGKGEIIF